MEILKFMVANWEVITLCVTNLGAYFLKSPLQKKE